MLKVPLKEVETRVNRTYRGGKILDAFYGRGNGEDTFQPEDWISSFTAAKNRITIPNEGITRVCVNGETKLITDAVTPEDFGQGRTEAGVLTKFIDAAERLGIQVHPTDEYAKRVFGTPYGKTECWHILNTAPSGGCVYLGFREWVTKEYWRQLFEKQDVQGMLDAMHCFSVRQGDTILVTGGTPHAIGAGCFLLEIQQPTDYTMRAEKVTVAGEVLTPMQIHYGAGEEKMLECFDYTPVTGEELHERYFLRAHGQGNRKVLVSYKDTRCFALEEITGGTEKLEYPHFVTAVFTENGGTLSGSDFCFQLKRGDKYFIPAGCRAVMNDAHALICLPPEKRNNSRDTLTAGV